MNTTQTCIATLVAATWLSLPTEAAVLVSGTVQPSGGAFQYDISFVNTGPEDVALVTLAGAPLGDPLIGPSLTAPANAVASYDSILGLLDLVAAGTDFLAATQTGPFRFESLAGPGTAFGSFEAMDVQGQSTHGLVTLTVIPEPAVTTSAMALVLLGYAWRRHCKPR